MRSNIEQITYSKIKHIKDVCGMGIQDVAFLFGRSINFPLTDEKIIEKGDGQTESIPFALIMRVLDKDPSALPFDLITHEEAFELIQKYEPDIKYGNYSIYLGLGYWPANDWKRGVSSPPTRIGRVFMMIKNLTDLYGQEGWEIWKDSLNEEAIARGTTFQNVLKYKTWNPEKHVG